MSEPYVLRKNGMYYAHNSCGYVSRVELAELYTKEYAEHQVSQCDDLSAHPVTNLISDVGHIDNVIDRLEAMKEAIEIKKPVDHDGEPA